MDELKFAINKLESVVSIYGIDIGILKILPPNRNINIVITGKHYSIRIPKHVT